MALSNVAKYFFVILFLIFVIANNFSCQETISPIDLENVKGQIVSEFGTAAIRPDGSFWGNSYVFGILPPDNYTLTKIGNFNNFCKITMSNGRCLTADLDGNIWYSGDDCVTSTFSPMIAQPQKISKLNNIKSIRFSRAVVNLVNILGTDGKVWNIKINPGNPTNFQEPVLNNNLINIRDISQTIALGTDGKLYELKHWDPEHGGIINGLKDIIDLENVYYRRTVILKCDGEVWAWGQNTMGELGNGTLENSAVPTQTVGLKHIIDISSNFDFNLALKNDGTVWY